MRYHPALALLTLGALLVPASCGFETYNPTLPLELEFSENDPDFDYIVVMTDHSQIRGYTLSFESNDNAYPRIIYAAKMEKTSAGAVATIPPIQFPQTSGNISIHYFRIEPIPPYFGMEPLQVTFTDFSTDSWITKEDTGGITTGYPWDVSDVVAVIISLAISGGTIDAFCSYHMSYQGIVISVNFNGVNAGPWTRSNYEFKNVTSTDKIFLVANQYTMLTLFGLRLQLVEFSLVNCEDVNGNPIDPSQYVVYNVTPISSVIQNYTFNIPSANFTCPPNAKRCLSATKAAECDPPYLRDEYQCVLTCPPGKYPVNGGVCVSDTHTEVCDISILSSDYNSYNSSGYKTYCAVDYGSPTLRIILPGHFIRVRTNQILVNASNVLPRAYLMDITYQFTTINVESESNIPINTSIPGEYSLGLFNLETDPTRQIQVGSYSSADYPNSIIDLSYMLPNQNLTLNETNYYIISTLFGCPTQDCGVDLIATGKIKAYYDYSVLLVDGDVGSVPLRLRLQIPWASNLTYLKIEVSKSTLIGLEFSGSYVLNSNGVLYGYNTFPTPQSTCTLANPSTCNQCEGSICLVCKPGYYLTDNNECSPSCPVLIDEIHRKCVSACPDNTVSNGTHCIPDCAEYPNRFFIPGEGCVGIFQMTLGIDGEPALTVHHFEKNLVLGKLSINSTGYNPNLLIIQWNQTSGPSLNLNSLVNPTAPLLLNIPSCTLIPEESYEFTLTVVYLSIMASSTITLTVRPEEFDTVILKGNRAHPYSQELTLSGAPLYRGSCTPLSDPLAYSWTCLKNGVTCDDPDLIFQGSQSKDLSLPTTYFEMGDTLTLSLTITKGAYSSTATTEIQIGDLSTLIIHVTCSGSCSKYVRSLQTVLTANVMGSSDGDSLNYTWTLSGSNTFPYAAFSNQFKSLPNRQAIGTGSIQILLDVQNFTHKGNASFSLPINTPPSGGSLTVSIASWSILLTNLNLKSNCGRHLWS